MATKRSWVAILRNPKSGSERGRRELLELVSELRRRGLQPRLFSHRERLQQRLTEPVLRERLLCVVAAGGDGTVGDVINRYPDLPIAVLPLGTENLLACYLRIPRSERLVAQMIADRRT